jgi:uncharacterized tellurite resistance protein B-like protein/DnaJ-domain-containing protein 1
MAKHPVAMALAKVIIAAAWADGDLAHDEVNTLKNLLAELGQTGGREELALTATEWAELEIYLYSPVGVEERARLVAELVATLSGPHDRRLALEALDQVVQADRVLAAEERVVAAEIRDALMAADLGVLAQLGKLVRGGMRARASGPNREDHLDEFLTNRVYYAVRQRLGRAPDEDLGIPLDEARVLALAGGLLAHVARIDGQVDAAELTRIREALSASWGIDATKAAVVAEAALAESAAGLDYYRLTKEFADRTSVERRAGFLDALFAVAGAAGGISSEESATISRITQSLNLTHDHFIAAKRRARAGE